jgi:hypothetical protein
MEIPEDHADQWRPLTTAEIQANYARGREALLNPCMYVEMAFHGWLASGAPLTPEPLSEE